MAWTESEQKAYDADEQRHKRTLELERERQTAVSNLDMMKNRMEILRTAKEVLFENRKNKPVNEREITHEEIVTFATALEEFVKK